MRISIEQVLLENFAVDFLFLAAATRYQKRTSLSRLLLAAAFGALFGGLTALLNPKPVWRFLLGVGFSPVLSRAACKNGGLTVWKSLLTVSVFAAGAVYLVSPLLPGSVPVVLTGAACVAVTRKRDGLSRRTEWLCTIRLRHGDCLSTFEALIDTGNRLLEPVSGLPVLLVEERLLNLPVNFHSRSIAYGGVGGNGTLRCFYPDHLYMLRDGIRVPLRDIYVAVYPDRLPGRHHALAPAEVLLRKPK